jgi:predicted nucleotidyltransferase
MLDLRPDLVEMVRGIVTRHLPGRAVWAFGSRVTGRATLHSDLDLAIMGEGPVDPVTMALLRDDLRESNLPIKVDLVEWVTVPPTLQAAIQAVHQVLLPTGG